VAAKSSATTTLPVSFVWPRWMSALELIEP